MVTYRFVEIYSNHTMDTTLAAVVSTVGGCRPRIASRWPAQMTLQSKAFLILGHVDFNNELELHQATSFLSRTKSVDRFPAVVIVASNLTDDQESIEKQKRLLDLGVLEILERPLNLQRLRYVIESQKLKFDYWLKQQSVANANECQLNVRDELQKKLAKISAVDTNVMLSGETGVGKTYWAEFVHKRSVRSKRPFVVVNCANFTPTLVESQMFGHTKGAFTGADRNQPGQFEHAGSGTIFLDEVDSLSLEIQAKLLRVVENREFRRLGDNKPIPMKARIISATNCNLDDMIADKSFRADLFYRLNAYEIQIPPLRERRSEIESLCHVFLSEFTAANGKSVNSFDADVTEMLLNYPWPGNLRELRNCVQYGAIDADGSIILAKNLPPRMRAYFEDQRLSKDDSPQTQTLRLMGGGNPRVGEHDEVLRLVKALENSGYNRSKAAKELGVSRMTVYNMLKRHNLG